MTTTPNPIRRLWLFVATVGLLSTAHAADPLVDARMTVALIRQNGSLETSGAASNAKPGDILEYTAHYANRGDGAARALMPTMPIPVGTAYLPAERDPQPTQASLDGVRWSDIPLRRQVRGSDGNVHDEDVPFSEYRALRWTVGPLAPGSQITVRARVRVAPVAIPG